MPRTLTAADRSALIRLASTMPSGSPERRAILASLWPATDRSVFDLDPNAQVSVQDVDKVLSALITGPGWAPDGVRMVEREAIDLTKQGYGREVLMGIMEWINNEDVSTPGMAHAYQVIAHIGRRIGQPIKPYGQGESEIIVRLLNGAYMP